MFLRGKKCVCVCVCVQEGGEEVSLCNNIDQVKVVVNGVGK